MERKKESSELVNTIIESLSKTNIASGVVSISGRSQQLVSVRANSAIVTLRGSHKDLSSALIALGNTKYFTAHLSLRGTPEKISSAIVGLGRAASARIGIRRATGSESSASVFLKGRGSTLASAIANLKGISEKYTAIRIRGTGSDLVSLSNKKGFASATVNIRGSSEEIVKTLTPIKGVKGVSAVVTFRIGLGK